jgi:undecaprenyl-diphosphatase
MDYLLVIFAGALQGVTEFLPISSSAHLVLFHDIFNFNLPDNLAFDAVLHLGTFFSLLIFFGREIWQLIKGFFSSLTNWNLQHDFNQRLAWLIIIGSLPALIVGFAFDDLIDKYFHEGRLVIAIIAFMLAAGAVLFWLAEKYAKQVKELNNLTWRQSLVCGLAQAVALVPGVSRSGVVIIAGMTQKMKRADAAKFSFLLSLPVVLGAGASSLFRVNLGAEIDLLSLSLGFVTAAFFGYLAVKYFLRFVAAHSLSVFAWYRAIVAAVLTLWLLL